MIWEEGGEIHWLPPSVETPVYLKASLYVQSLSYEHKFSFKLKLELITITKIFHFK